MKAFQKTIVLGIIIVFSLALSGCGVSKEEHEKTRAELQKVQIELKEAKEKIAELKKSPAAELESTLHLARERVQELTEKLSGATLENTRLKEEIDKLQALVEEHQETITRFKEKAKDLPTDLLKQR